MLELFHKTFGVTPAPISPKADMAEIFARAFRESISVDGGTEVSANGCSVTLATPEQREDKAHVVVVNNHGSVATALEEGLRITKMTLLAVDGERETTFSLADDLAISGLKLPKGEKGDDADAMFLLKADACAHAAHIVEALSK